MKILIFNTLYYPNQIGGAEKSVQLLAEGLLENGEKPIVVCTSDKDYIDYVNSVKVYYVKTNNLYWTYNAKEENKLKKPLWHFLDSYNFLNKNKIEKIIKKENPDVVHTNNLAGFSDIVWNISKKYNIKIVHTLRDYYQLCPKSTMFKNNKTCQKQCNSCKLYSIPKKESSKYIDVVVGISKFILNKHLEYGYFKNAKKEVIYNPISMPNNIEKSAHDGIILGYVGSLSPSKGIELLLQSSSNLNFKNIKLYIYGKGITKSYESELKEKYAKSNIIFQGFQKPEEIYKNIDILVVPSLWNEPFGRIVPEANSYNIPVLVSNKGGLPELVEDGKNGYIFDSGRKKDFEEKLKLIINDFNKNDFEFDIDLLKLDKIIAKYCKVYGIQ